MLTNSQKIMKFILLVIIFSIILGVSSYFINNYEIDKENISYRSSSLPQNIIVACLIMLIVCCAFYLLKLIPVFNAASTIVAGIVIFILSCVVMTSFVIMGAIDPFTKKYAVGLLVRFWATFFIPLADKYLTKWIGS